MPEAQRSPDWKNSRFFHWVCLGFEIQALAFALGFVLSIFIVEARMPTLYIFGVLILYTMLMMVITVSIEFVMGIVEAIRDPGQSC